METKRYELVQRLAGMIATPGYFPGGKLPPERDLARTLGVSRNLLREAMITLETQGRIQIRDRQGTFLVPPGGDELFSALKYIALWPDDILIHLMELRLVVETPIAALAATRRTEEEVRKMRECVRKMVACRGDADGGAAAGAEWDSLLHVLVVDAAHNPLLSRLYEGLAATMNRYVNRSRAVLMALESWPEKLLREHDDLVQAIAAGDAAAAEAAQRRHLGHALDMLRRLAASA